MISVLEEGRDESKCRFCGAKLSLVKRMRKEEFCSTQHREEFYLLSGQMALERLQQAETPKPESKPLVAPGPAPARLVTRPAEPATAPLAAATPSTTKPSAAPDAAPAAPAAVTPAAPEPVSPPEPAVAELAADAIVEAPCGFVADSTGAGGNLGPAGPAEEYLAVEDMAPKASVVIPVTPEAQVSFRFVLEGLEEPGYVEFVRPVPGDVLTILVVRAAPEEPAGEVRRPKRALRPDPFDWKQAEQDAAVPPSAGYVALPWRATDWAAVGQWRAASDWRPAMAHVCESDFERGERLLRLPVHRAAIGRNTRAVQSAAAVPVPLARGARPQAGAARTAPLQPLIAAREGSPAAPSAAAERLPAAESGIPAQAGLVPVRFEIRPQAPAAAPAPLAVTETAPGAPEVLAALPEESGTAAGAKNYGFGVPLAQSVRYQAQPVAPVALDPDWQGGALQSSVSIPAFARESEAGSQPLRSQWFAGQASVAFELSGTEEALSGGNWWKAFPPPQIPPARVPAISAPMELSHAGRNLLFEPMQTPACCPFAAAADGWELQ